MKLLKESSHNQILAVTFTNKATEEMKSRIVKELNKCAKEKGDKQALEFLKTILHDYSHFNISTIDKFFQKIVRSMFRDIDADCYIMVDGDDTYPAESALEFEKLVLEKKVDMVIFHLKQILEIFC